MNVEIYTHYTILNSVSLPLCGDSCSYGKAVFTINSCKDTLTYPVLLAVIHEHILFSAFNHWLFKHVFKMSKGLTDRQTSN